LNQNSYVNGFIAGDQLSLVSGTADFQINQFKFIGYTY